MGIVTFDSAQIAATDIALSNGNLTALELSSRVGQYQSVSANAAIAAAKIYFEIYWNTWSPPVGSTTIGLAPYDTGGIAGQSEVIGNTTGTAGWRCNPPSNTFWYVNNSGFNSIPQWGQGNTCQVAIDCGAQLFWGQVSGTSGWNAGGNPVTGSGGYSYSVLGTGVLYPIVQFDNTILYEATANFGGTSFTYSPPSGFSAFGSSAALLMSQICLRERLKALWLPKRRRLLFPIPVFKPRFA